MLARVTVPADLEPGLLARVPAQQHPAAVRVTISADPVTCSGSDRGYGSGERSRSARTRATSAASASPSGW